jgi:twitching motility protein PilT
MLSFKDELKQIPQHIQGVDRISSISSILEKNNNYGIEARAKIHEYLEYMVKAEASDLDMGGIGTNGKIWYRISGNKKPASIFPKLDLDEATALIISILTQRQIDKIMFNQNTDFSYKMSLNGEYQRFRADAYMDMDFLAINFRRINSKPFDINTYGFSKQILNKFNLAYEKRGLILVTGITGSGKSTTLDSIIDMNNEQNDAHIVIIGNPIEYFHKSKRSIVRHREVGKDTLSFKQGAIEALRQDPDIIVVGEMRDPETIVTVLETTDSGHKVFSTLHTSSAAESIHRIIAECPPEEQNRVRNRLADVLKIVISQKLVPGLDGKLILAKEVLHVTPYVSAAIVNNNIGEIYQMITEGKDYGMITLEQDLFRLFLRKKISMENAIAFSNNKKRLLELIEYYRNR